MLGDKHSKNVQSGQDEDEDEEEEEEDDEEEEGVEDEEEEQAGEEEDDGDRRFKVKSRQYDKTHRVSAVRSGRCIATRSRPLRSRPLRLWCTLGRLRPES